MFQTEDAGPRRRVETELSVAGEKDRGISAELYQSFVTYLATVKPLTLRHWVDDNAGQTIYEAVIDGEIREAERQFVFWKLTEVTLVSVFALTAMIGLSTFFASTQIGDPVFWVVTLITGFSFFACFFPRSWPRLKLGRIAYYTAGLFTLVIAFFCYGLWLYTAHRLVQLHGSGGGAATQPATASPPTLDGDHIVIICGIVGAVLLVGMAFHYGRGLQILFEWGQQKAKLNIKAQEPKAPRVRRDPREVVIHPAEPVKKEPAGD